MLKMISEKAMNASTIYSAWFGKPVVLVVALRNCHVPVPCSIIGETTCDLHIRVQDGWEMDVQKVLILAVEEDAIAVDASVN
jgi:hypothetical protein